MRFSARPALPGSCGRACRASLTDVEIAQFTKHFLAHTLEVRGRYRTVVPDTILEVALDSIQPSARHESGFALRFPRIARVRTDKTVADIDALETCRRLGGSANPAGLSTPVVAPSAAKDGRAPGEVPHKYFELEFEAGRGFRTLDRTTHAPALTQIAFHVRPMTVRSFRLLSLLPFALASLSAAMVPLRDGEQLTYRVSWAIVPGAGEIKIAGRQDDSGPTPTMTITSSTATRRLARMLLPFDAESRSIFDLQTGKLISLHESSRHKGKRSEHRVTFDHHTRKAAYTHLTNPDASRVLDIPDGDPTDLMMGLLQTRTWDLKPGEKRDALVLFDDDFYELTIHMARYEDVSTSLGRFRTIVLEPRMDKTPPKGMFRRGSSVRIWIAQDSHRLPVKFEVEFKIGTGTATLETYVPPSKPAPSDGTNPRS